MQIHHLYVTCASSTTMATRLSWYRIDANIACHFGLRIQDSGLPKIRLKFPSMISRSLCTPSCAAHWQSFAASLTWSFMRATKGDTIFKIKTLASPGSRWRYVTVDILNFSQNLSVVGPQHHSKCEPNFLLVRASVGKCRKYSPQQNE